MITQTVTVTEKCASNIIIGRRGTYETVQIIFDITYLVETFGDGSAVLMVKRPPDTTAYPAEISRDGSNVIWAVSESDTAAKGHGEAEIFWYVNGGLAKSVIFSISILRDIGETTEAPPDPYENWVETLTALGAETQQNAQDAAQSASDAQTSAEDAAASKDAAAAAQAAAEAVLEEFTTPTAAATTLAPGSEATAEYSNGLFTFGIPQGETGATGPQGPQGDTGATGPQGPQGAAGFSPTATVVKSGNTANITITDENGTTTATVTDGENPTVDSALSPTSENPVQNKVIDAALDEKALRSIYQDDKIVMPGNTGTAGANSIVLPQTVSGHETDANAEASIHFGPGTTTNRQSNIHLGGVRTPNANAKGRFPWLVDYLESDGKLVTYTDGQSCINVGTNQLRIGANSPACSVGGGNVVTRPYGVAFGEYNIVQAYYSFLAGFGLKGSSNPCQTMFGLNADAESDDLLVVGNGSTSGATRTPSTAFQVKKDGSAIAQTALGIKKSDGTTVTITADQLEALLALLT